MKTKGSMTAAMSLMLFLLLSLLAACLQASRTACARVQAANGMDVGMYSLFSEYHSELFEEYHLFFLDAGFGGKQIQKVQLVNQTEAFMEPVLQSGLTSCELQACGITGLQLATDQKGSAVERQIVRYMKNHLGTTGIEALKQELSQNQEKIEQQKQIEEAGMEEQDITETVPMEEISEGNNPLEVIKSIQKNGFLGLVLASGTELSEKALDANTILSKREQQTGFGDFSELEDSRSAMDRIFIQEYIVQQFNCFTEKKLQEGLDYQIEYILGGKLQEKENLKAVVNRLLLLRETANLAFLYTNGEKRAELEACASALSLLFLIPEGMALVQGVLAAGWAYVESLSDVRILLSGGKVPLTKDINSWKTQLRALGVETNVSNTKGLDYQAYLRLLLSFSSKETLLSRSMDLIEQNIREKPGKENFSLDSCLESISMSFQIKGPDGKTWQAERMYSYCM